MPVVKDAVRVRHMLDAARKTVAFAKGRSRPDLDTDEQLTFALVHLLEVVGEAAKGVSGPCRAQYADVPWKEIAGTRDRLIHGYFDIDLNVVWRIIADDLPPLIAQLERIVTTL